MYHVIEYKTIFLILILTLQTCREFWKPKLYTMKYRTENNYFIFSLIKRKKYFLLKIVYCVIIKTERRNVPAAKWTLVQTRAEEERIKVGSLAKIKTGRLTRSARDEGDVVTDWPRP